MRSWDGHERGAASWKSVKNENQAQTALIAQKYAETRQNTVSNVSKLKRGENRRPKRRASSNLKSSQGRPTDRSSLVAKRKDQLQGKEKWCHERESNSRPHPYQGCALPLSYRGVPAMPVYRAVQIALRKAGAPIVMHGRNVKPITPLYSRKCILAKLELAV